MKYLSKYILGLVALAGMSVGFTACQDDFDDHQPAFEAPVATIKANTSIYELKTQYWDDATNYIDTIGVVGEKILANENRQDGDHIIISGRVISSDQAGNIFKSLVIQDETAALAISIGEYDLYLSYRLGQEIVIDVTNMYIGKYNGLQQLGQPEWYSAGSAWEATFMTRSSFEAHAQLNGMPDAAKIDTVLVNSFSDLGSSPADLCKYQSQLIRVNNVHFENGGTGTTFSTYKSSGVNSALLDANGTSLNVRTSGYSNFWNKELPAGSGDVVAIASYYGSSGYQLLLNDYAGCMNFGNPTINPGLESNPYSVDDAIAIEATSQTTTGWVTGYIVGAVAPGVETVSSNDDIEWTAPTILANTIVIGQTADTKDINHCLIVPLPDNTDLQKYANLVDNADVYGKQIWITGTLAEYMGTYGLNNSNGSASTFRIDGVTVSGAGAAEGTGTEESPYNVTQVIAMNPTSSSEAVSGGSGVWVTGYIVGWADMSSTYYINSTTAKFSVPATLATNLILALTPDVTDVASCIGIQLPSGTSVRSALNLMDNPGNLGKEVKVYGDIMKYSGVPGMKNTSKYVLGEGGSSTETTVTPVTSINENFDAATSIPSGWSQVQVEGNKSWYVPTYNSNNYAAMTGYNGTAPFDSWLMTPPVDMSQVSNKALTFDTQVNGYSSTTSEFEVYVLDTNNPSTATVKDKLTATIATAPSSGYSDWANSGSIDLSKYTGTIYVAFRYHATVDPSNNYATWCVDNVVLGDGAGTATPTQTYKGDFNTFNNGTANSSYGEYTNATGWTATNACILAGFDGEGDGTNPNFPFIGSASTLAPTLRGRTDACGSLVSPTLTGGIGTLTFNYGFAFTETQCQFTVNIYQGGTVVKTDTVKVTDITKAKAYEYSLAVNISGDFIIEIVNDNLSGASSNKDRVSIWNLTWD
jgi:hypothetical protein